MKKSTLLLVALLFSGISMLKAQSDSQVSITDPVEYNDYIVDAQNRIGKNLLDLMAVVNDLESTHEQAKTSLSVLNSTIDMSILSLENLKTLEPDFGIKQTAIELFLFYQKTMRTTYVIMVDEIYSAEPNLELLNKYMAEITEEEGKYDNAFQSSQEQFAAKHNISLEKNSIQDQLDNQSE
jgi:hypothetical protein